MVGEGGTVPKFESQCGRIGSKSIFAICAHNLYLET